MIDGSYKQQSCVEIFYSLFPSLEQQTYCYLLFYYQFGNNIKASNGMFCFLILSFLCKGKESIVAVKQSMFNYQGKYAF